MHVITRGRLVDFGKVHADAVVPLDLWYRLMKALRFRAPHELARLFGGVDFLGDGLVVFDIGGNKYRIVAGVRYSTETNIGRCYIKAVMEHDEYDQWSDERRRKKRKKPGK